MARFRYRRNVAYWHLADIPMYSANVRFWENSGRRDFGASCPLLTQSGHSPNALPQSNTGRKSAEYDRAPTDCHFLVVISMLRGSRHEETGNRYHRHRIDRNAAFAADMAVKVPPKPVAPAPVHSWTGFYVGANGGYGWKNPTVTFTPNDEDANFVTCVTGTCAPPASFNINGGFGGLQAGYNWQFSPQWVAGVETDFDWSDIKGTGTSNFLMTLAPAAPFPSNFAVFQNIKWFGTVRARLGYLPADHLLVYATGGFAYGRIDENVALNAGSTGGVGSGAFTFLCVAGPNCFLGNSSRTATGWTAGGGVEYVLWNNVSVKAEYLYVNLGGGDSVDVVAQSTFGGLPSSFTAAFSRTDFHTVRGGLNWKFY
jgi:outer membrane immunogenic protein